MMFSDSAAGSAAIPASVQNAVLQSSSFDPEGKLKVSGLNYEDEITVDSLMGSMMGTGFQATNVALAINEINNMLAWRKVDTETGTELKCTIFFAYTSNMISSGLREAFLFLVKHNLVDVVVTTAGGIEEDFIKCLGNTYVGDFKLKGADLRAKGVNRLGNLLVPNQNYCLFEDWVAPILHTMTDEQIADGTRWTPSTLIHRLGKEINHEESVYYWAYKNNIPVFCPAITDGSLGDMMYFHSYRREEFIVDVVADIRKLNDISMHAACSGMVILGGGVAKHHTNNANLMRNGADFSVNISTAQEFDGSDSGANPDEAVSWGKIKVGAKPVKVHSDATLVFPLILTQTFLKEYKRRQQAAIAMTSEDTNQS